MQKARSDWLRLLRIAHSLIDQVNSEFTIIDRWTLGGGTAIMIQLDHRESHDIDIFLDDPQLLPFLDPAKRDFNFEIWPSDYRGDGSRFMKMAFEAGEIDFIVAAAITDFPPNAYTFDGRLTLVESVPEIIAKKVYYRGSAITPRDVFDIAAGITVYRDEISRALMEIPSALQATVAQMEKLNPEFVQAVIAELMVRDAFRDTAETAFERAREFLTSIEIVPPPKHVT